MLAHELAHVVQQTQPAEASAKAAASDAAFEKEAHSAADRVLAGGTASPQLRTGSARAQGYGSPEHQDMGNAVHSVLAPAADGETQKQADQHPVDKIGGVSPYDLRNQEAMDAHANGATHFPDVPAADRKNPSAVAVPQLKQMLANDPFTSERARTLDVSLRHFAMQRDENGPYLAIETDGKGHAARFNARVSPGDLTAMNGDLYGSMENLRKAPISEVLHLQRVLDLEAQWEHSIAIGKSKDEDEPDFDAAYEKATAWRGQPVYVAGEQIAVQGDATGGDTSSYLNLALDNRAHFGQDTTQKHDVEVQVNAGNLAQLSAGPQGNAAKGNEQAWIDGHARALQLAREAYVLKQSAPSAEKAAAQTDHYGHEDALPETGMTDPAKGVHDLYAPSQGNSAKQSKPVRDDGQITSDVKANDAYTENAGADHYLTDAFAAGHQIVRDVIGQVTDQFVKDKGGRDKFLEFVTKKLQEGAIADPKSAKQPELHEFQRLSKGGGFDDADKARRTARGDAWINHFGDGMRQQLDKKLDATTLHGIGAKLVHDYYNRHGMVVHNRKGMTFIIMGDGHAIEAPEARKVIAMAVLESRNQITETVKSGATANMLSVWDYTPDIDKTAFTLDSGRKILDLMFQSPSYLWDLLKEHFPTAKSDKDPDKDASKASHGEKAIKEANHEGKDSKRGTPADIGAAPLKSWFEQRQAYVKQLAKGG
ncbi:MAG TPA: hypothetical protein VGM88_09190 [Kofleriaceae bacterium]